MPAFRINAFLAAALLCAVPARADDAPAPPDDTTTVPDAPDAPTTTGPVATSGPVSVGDINIADGDAVGTLDDGHDGFGSNMWVGAKHSDLEELLDALPVNSRNPVVRDLAIRLLLTRSESPVGSGKHSLVTLRLRKLIEAGVDDEAGSIAAQARVSNDPDFRLVQAEAFLLAGLNDWACGDATNARLSEGDPFWLELRAYCYGLAGDQAQVDLIDQLLEAQGQTDLTYKMLRDDVLQHLNYMPGVIADPKPIHVFLLKIADLQPPPEVTAKFHLGFKRPMLPSTSSEYVVPTGELVQAAQNFSTNVVADTNTQRHAALLIDLADALGEPLTSDVQAALPQAQAANWSGSRPSEAELTRIADAASVQERRGEAILRLIETLDARDLGDMAPDAAAHFVRLLRQLGLESEARALAIEALKAYRDPPPPPVDTGQPG